MLKFGYYQITIQNRFYCPNLYQGRECLPLNSLASVNRPTILPLWLTVFRSSLGRSPLSQDHEESILCPQSLIHSRILLKYYEVGLTSSKRRVRVGILALFIDGLFFPQPL